MIQILAPAKLNIGLEVLGRRPDGYHELRTIFCAVSLFDRVSFAPATESCVVCDLGIGSTANLAEIALDRMRESIPDMPHVRISIIKGIPAAAGLGGASSDAAAVLLGLNRIAGSPTSTDLIASLALECGSDVPFFLSSGLALGIGRGEEISPLPLRSPIHAVVITPNVIIPDKTRMMYGQLGPEDWTTGRRVESLAERLANGNPLPLQECLPNTFRRPLYDLFPAVRLLAERIGEAIKLPVQVSGAGPSLFVLCSDVEHAQRIQRRLRATIDRNLATVHRVRSTASILISEDTDV
jgi:4-diphosphocytidyl-2-C-methyl-D-erythritol kinase